MLIPYFGEFKVKVASTSYSLVANDLTENLDYSFSVEFINPPYSFLQALSSYLMLETKSDYGLKTLLKNGFVIPDLSSVIQFQTFFLNKMTPYDEKIWHKVLELRLRASQKSGRWKGETDCTKLIDEYDKHACHVIYKIKGCVVGSSRIVLNNNEIQRVEHAKITEIPESFWNDGFVDLSRASIEPKYQGMVIFDAMMNYTTKIVSDNNFRYALMNCANYLIPIYKEYGGREMGIQFSTEYMQGVTLNLIQFDRVHNALGRNLSPRIWYTHWKDWYFYGLKNKSISLNIFDKVRIVYCNVFGFISFKYREYQTAKRELKKRAAILEKFKHVSE